MPKLKTKIVLKREKETKILTELFGKLPRLKNINLKKVRKELESKFDWVFYKPRTQKRFTNDNTYGHQPFPLFFYPVQ